MSIIKSIWCSFLITVFSFIINSEVSSQAKKSGIKQINSFSIDKKSTLWKYIDNLTVIDCHEHISSEAELLNVPVDFYNLLTPYIVDNLESAGISNADMGILKDGSQSAEKRWKIFNNYYPLIKNSTYMLALQQSLQTHYQLNDFSYAEISRISEALKNDFAQKGYMKRILGMNKIESVVTMRPPFLSEIRRNYGEDDIQIAPVLNATCVIDSGSLTTISKMAEMPVRTIDDILAAYDKIFAAIHAQGLRNIKINSAYNRLLNYKSRTKAEAQASFEKILQTPFDYSKAQPNKYFVYTLEDYHYALDDYLTIYMVQLAEKYQLNMIFHVSLAAWNYNSVKNSHTSDLEWLIKNFPKVNFGIIHSGYPYFEEAILYAKYYPNVFIDMAWLHIIERRETINLMKRYVEMLPINKISAFGGDYIFPQQITGHLIFAKENLYVALNELIQEGTISEIEAKRIAYTWMYENPKRFYLKTKK